MRLRRLFVPALVVLLAVMMVVPALAQMEPAVTADDQELMDGTVTVASVVSEGAGWIVIHEDQNGDPGAVIGHAAVQDGENTNVSVTLDTELMGETTLWAMLHTDTGTEGEYDFPDADPPVQDAEGNIVQDSFVASPSMMEDDSMEADESMEGEDSMSDDESMSEDDSMEGDSGESMSEGDAPETMPETGGDTPLTNAALAVAIGLVLLGGAFVLRRRQHA